MKRSSVIQHIEWLLMDNHPISLSDSKQLAEEILDCLEACGMKPPTILKFNDEVQITNIDQRLKIISAMKVGETLSTVNEWENETK